MAAERNAVAKRISDREKYFFRREEEKIAFTLQSMDQCQKLTDDLVCTNRLIAAL